MSIKLREIVKNYLEQNGFGGLFNSDGECGCELPDLMPCDQPSESCCAGYKIKCNEKCDHECGKCDWHIQEEKP